MVRDSNISVLLPHRMLGNIYVQELGRAYRQLGCEVVFGPENFFESNYAPDIVHINWPEDLYRGFGYGTVLERGDRLIERLSDYREAGAYIAWTVHNEKPHDSSDSDTDARIYQQVISSADIIHHHCDCSRDLLTSRYEISAHIKQFVAAHGHYFSYKNEISREAAKRELRIDGDGMVFLHFGAIRGYKGIDIVLDAFKKSRQKYDRMFVVGRLTDSGGIREKLKFGYYRHLVKSLEIHLHTVDSDRIQTYINASDVMVLGHTSGLNSGVAVLGMSFGKPVIAPSIGCISSVLQQGENMLYEPGNIDALARKLASARNLDFRKIHDMNQEAARRWRWEDIAGPVLDGYRQR